MRFDPCRAVAFLRMRKISLTCSHVKCEFGGVFLPAALLLEILCTEGFQICDMKTVVLSK